MPSRPPQYSGRAPSLGPVHNVERGSAAERGYDARWRRARLFFLRKNPLCKSCQERDIIIPATVVDHVIPHNGNKVLFWAESNWQALCKRCHDQKTAGERRLKIV